MPTATIADLGAASYVSDTWLTPGRVSSLLIDPDETIAVRTPWMLSRGAGRMANLGSSGRVGPAGLPKSQRVLQLPGPVWIMQPVTHDPLKFATPADPGPIPGGLFNATVDMHDTPWWQANLLPGMSGGDISGLSPTLSGFLYRRPQASWTNELPSTRPKPVNPSNMYPMLKVASGLQTFPQNTGFRFLFTVPHGHLMGPRHMLTFYFGGSTDVTPNTLQGGEFALHFYTDGQCTLFEMAASGWVERAHFRWSSAGFVAGTIHGIDIIPYGRDCIAIRSTNSDQDTFKSTLQQATLSPSRTAPGWNLYRDTHSISGIDSRSAMTGLGTVEIDMRADLALGVAVWPFVYPDEMTLSVLVDAPFAFDTGPLPANTPVSFGANVFHLRDSGYELQLWDPDTAALMTFDGTQQAWLANAGQTRAYPQYIFTASSDGYGTPVLYYGQHSVDGLAVTRTGTNITGGTLRSYTGTGPDIDPSHEMIHIEVEDLLGELGILQQRSRIRFQLRTTYDPLDETKFTILFDGELSLPEGQPMVPPNSAMNGAATADSYPSDEWSHFEITGVGMWARIEDKRTLCLLPFGDSDTDPTEPRTIPPDPKKKAWRITAAVSKMLEYAGVLPSMIDIQEEGVIGEWRFGSLPDLEETSPDPAGSIGAWLASVLEEYLGRWIIWDPNARGAGAPADGMWRLLAQPKTTDASIFAFTRADFSGGDHLSTRPYVYGDDSTWIEDRSLRRWVKAPEFDLLIVTSSGEVAEAQAGPSRLVQYFPTSAAYDADPAHPTSDPTSLDYMGFVAPVTFYDPMLTTPELVSHVGRTLSDFAGHAQNWMRWRAPLVLVKPAADGFLIRPRPLRLNDIVTVDGTRAVIRSCNYDCLHDGMQMAIYEAVEFPAT